MPVHPDAAAFHADIRALVHAWCDRHDLAPLADLLPAWLAFNGLTDGWQDLAAALRTVATRHQDRLPPPERATLDRLRRTADRVLSGPPAPGLAP